MERSPHGNTAMIRRENKNGVKLSSPCQKRFCSGTCVKNWIKLCYCQPSHPRTLKSAVKSFPESFSPSAGGRPSQTYCFHSAFRHGAILYGTPSKGRDSYIYVLLILLAYRFIKKIVF